MEISISAEKLFEIAGFPVTNSMLLSLVVLIFLGVLTYFGTRKLEEVPKPHSMQNVFELGIEKLLGLVDSVTKNRKLSMQIFPILATFFIFILFNNWFGILPGVGSIGIHETIHGKEVFIPIFRAGTADLNTTIMLGIGVVIATQVIGIVTLGFFKYGKKFINFSNPVKFFIGLIELASELIRIISFAFRLFGNVFAGEVLLIILAGLAPFVAPIPFYIMELFVGFIQALVFTMLALVFMTMATASHDDHEDHKEEPAVVPEEREEIARPATVEELKAELREMGRLADETEEPVVTGDGEVEAPDAVTVEAEEVEEKKSSKKKTRASKKLVKEAEEA